MKIEEIRESIEVIAVFTAGKLSPLRFRWRDRVYHVKRVNGGWLSGEGRSRYHHFAVSVNGPDVYEISYNERSQQWQLEKVSLVG